MGDAGPLDDIPIALWGMVARADRRLLMLDYDGTLAPLDTRRDSAHPAPESLRLLRRVADSSSTEVAIVSGRPLSEIAALVGPLNATLVGEHGWEWGGPVGGIFQHPLEEHAARALSEAAQAARDVGWEEHLERKRTAIVLHTRRLPAARAGEIEARAAELWRRFGSDPSFALDRIDGGLELRARQHNKGESAQLLLAVTGPDTLGVFVGDDVSDEDAFEAVRDQGFGIRVGDARRPTHAQGRLPSPAAVPAFLDEWLRLTGGAGTH